MNKIMYVNWQLLKACADGKVEDIEDLIRSDSSLQLSTAKNAVWHIILY